MQTLNLRCEAHGEQLFRRTDKYKFMGLKTRRTDTCKWGALMKNSSWAHNGATQHND